jgi:polyphosphate kinase
VQSAAQHGKAARVVLKMNALTDEALIAALIKTAEAGARVSLIVRGVCMLRPQKNIQIRSIIGRFLEHTRVYYFRAGKVESLWLASADWMGRNMFRRVEAAWPVEDKTERQRIIDECLVPYLHDGIDAWNLLADGSYAVASELHPASAQCALMARYAS